MLRIQISVPPEVVETLFELAQEELRTARDEAAILLMEAVKHRERQARRRKAPEREREVARVAG
jgi:hypothetical protein